MFALPKIPRFTIEARQWIRWLAICDRSCTNLHLCNERPGMVVGVTWCYYPMISNDLQDFFSRTFAFFAPTSEFTPTFLGCPADGAPSFAKSVVPLRRELSPTRTSQCDLVKQKCRFFMKVRNFFPLEGTTQAAAKTIHWHLRNVVLYTSCVDLWLWSWSCIAWHSFAKSTLSHGKDARFSRPWAPGQR